MEGPSHRFRQMVAERASALADEEGADGLEGLLDDIISKASADLEGAELMIGSEAGAVEVLGTLESWASITSDALIRFYGPESPLKRRLAGWSKGVANRITKFTNLLRVALSQVAPLLGANQFSIGIGFPWPSVSISLTW